MKGFWVYGFHMFSYSTILKDFIDLVDIDSLSLNIKHLIHCQQVECHCMIRTWFAYQVFAAEKFAPYQINTWGDFRIATEELRLQKNEAAFGEYNLS